MDGRMTACSRRLRRPQGSGVVGRRGAKGCGPGLGLEHGGPPARSGAFADAELASKGEPARDRDRGGAARVVYGRSADDARLRSSVRTVAQLAPSVVPPTVGGSAGREAT